MSEELPDEHQPQTYTVHGRAVYRESGQPAEGLRVVAMDADSGSDDRLGEDTTSQDGGFHITFDADRFTEWFEHGPDVYVRVYGNNNELLATTNGRIVYDAGHQLEINVEVPGAADIPSTRSQFSKLVLGNPNYFGNMPELGFVAIEPMTGNTLFEEIICLGLQPDEDRLEAVVLIKRPFGYGTDACGPGTTEYVRFFVEDNGGWRDLGTASFQAYNTPSSQHPLCYTVSVELDEPSKFCTIENLLNVRAILSWNQEPPAGNANWTPAWGNTIDATVQIDAFKLDLAPVGDLIAAGTITIDPSVLDQIDVLAPLPAKPFNALSYTQLKALYEGAGVPGHRFGFTDALALSEGPVTSDFISQLTAAGGGSGLLPGTELAEIINDLVITSGNTFYEELTCAGYNPATRELAGVISIKRSSGYSGGLCTQGSTEYVGFWVEYEGSWHALGVAEVQVHDLSGAGDGNTVEYAVFRFTNAVPEVPCENLSGLRLRAILSWNLPPAGPNFTPFWGNVVETFIQPSVGGTDGDGLRLMRFNRAPIDAIDDTTGRANNPMPVAGDCGGIDRPFGGTIFIEGDFVNKLDVFNDVTGDVQIGQNPLRYQVFWHKDGSPEPDTQLTNSFTIKVFPENGPPVTKTQSITTINGVQYYTYMESNTQAVNPRTLAGWQAGGLDDGLYTVEVKGFAWNGSDYDLINTVSQKIYVYNGYPHLEPVAQPDGTILMVPRQRPQILLTVDGGDCPDVVAGGTISGTYEVRDFFFRTLTVRMVPVTIDGTTHVNTVAFTNPGPVVPHAGVNPSLQTVTGTWSMNTSGLPACGYNIELSAWDRALVSNSCSGHHNRLAVGFCVREPSEP